MPSFSKSAVCYKKKSKEAALVFTPGQRFVFPDQFTWGVSSSSHQAEGQNVDSDWWRFERVSGKVQNFDEYPEFAKHYKSDHWRRFADDIHMMKQDLHVNSYRFSLEWSRIEPRPKAFDQSVMDRYVSMCALMQEKGIRPMVTLFHWSSPDWIWDHDNEWNSGWYDPAIVDHFERFCAFVVPQLTPYVDLFITLNEPNIFLYGGYSEGILAPGHQRDDDALLRIHRHLLQCHVRAWQCIKNARPDAQVGIAHQYCPFEPASTWNPLEGWIAARVEQGFTWSFPDALASGQLVYATRKGRYYRETVSDLAGTADFSGVNYYEPMVVKVPWGVGIRHLRILNDYHTERECWPRDIYTQAFIQILQRVAKRYALPIYVTENGRAHTDDEQRKKFIAEHIKTIAFARQTHQIDIRGYFYWSLMDNQEWANGFLPRLGLYEVDFANGARSLRDSGRYYGKIVSEKQIQT